METARQQRPVCLPRSFICCPPGLLASSPLLLLHCWGLNQGFHAALPPWQFCKLLILRQGLAKLLACPGWARTCDPLASGSQSAGYRCAPPCPPSMASRRVPHICCDQWPVLEAATQPPCSLCMGKASPAALHPRWSQGPSGRWWALWEMHLHSEAPHL